MYELHQYPFSKRTHLPSSLWASALDSDGAGSERLETSPKLFAYSIGLDPKVRPAFPFGGERAFDFSILKELSWNPRSVAEGLDALLFAMPVIGFPVREHLGPWLKDEALKSAKRQFESPLAYLLSLLVGKSPVLISKTKRCADAWLGASETKGGFADLPKEFPAHDLDDRGFRLMDFIFDSVSYLEHRRQIGTEAAIMFRVETLKAAFGYSNDRFYCASLIRQWEQSQR